MSESEVLNPTIMKYDYYPTNEFNWESEQSGFSVNIKTYVSLVKLEDFEKLKNEWISETGYFSDPDIIRKNEKYKQIIKLGYKVLPHILNDLKLNHNDWFFALNEITKANPIKKEHAGDVIAMTKDWLEWSERNLAF